MHLAQRPRENAHVVDLNQNVVMIGQDAPGSAVGAKVVKRIQQFLLKPLQTLRCPQDVLMFVTGGGDESIGARVIKVRRPMPGKSAPLAFRNDGRLLVWRQPAILVHHATPRL